MQARTFVTMWLASCSALIPPRVSAQNAPLVTLSRATCSSCGLTLQMVTQIVDTLQGGVLGGWVNLAEDSRGRLYAITNVARSQIVVYDGRGTRLSVLGRAGRGPGEFMVALPPAFSPTDSMYVADYGNMRLSVFGPDYQLAREVFLGVPITHYISLHDGSIVIGGPMPKPRSAGYPLHLLSPAGDHVRSFGSESGMPTSGGGRELRRSIAEASPTSFWAAHETRYRIERWTMEGRAELVIERHPDWMEGAPLEADPHSFKPAGTIVGVAQRGELLFILAHVADAKWQPRAGATGNEARQSSVLDNESLFDAIIDVVDLAKMEIVASFRSPKLMWFVGNSAKVYTIDATPIGETVLSVFDVKLGG